MYYINKFDVGYWLFVEGSRVYLKNNQPLFGNSKEFDLVGNTAYKIGSYNNFNVWLVDDNTKVDKKNFYSLRNLLPIEHEWYTLFSRAIELVHFFNSNKFCGTCGSKNRNVEDSMYLHCDKCEQARFPVICPSIIVAVRRGPEILLANHVRHKQERLYTVLAGFVEIGESNEQAVEREVYEETGIKVQNIRYYNSQAWAFPNSLMVGFLADYADGDIRIQKDELTDAGWFHYNKELPALAPVGTLARELIESTLNLCKD